MKSLKKRVFDIVWACGGLLWLGLAATDIIHTITGNSRTGWPLEFALAVDGVLWLGILAVMILLYRGIHIVFQPQQIFFLPGGLPLRSQKFFWLVSGLLIHGFGLLSRTAGLIPVSAESSDPYRTSTKLMLLF